MISVCFGELGITDYNYLYRMTMAEFNIRLFAFKRMTRDKEMLFREVAYSSLIGSHSDPKKLPKTKQQFWQIGHETKSELDEKKALAEMMRGKIKQFKQGKNV